MIYAGKAWAGLRVQLGQAPGHQHDDLHPCFNQPHRKADSPSRQRRRARRAAARQQAEEATKQDTSKKTSETAGQAEENLTIVTEQSENESEVTPINAEEADIKSMIITDEVCKDDEYENEPKSICSVDIFPIKYSLDRLESFRSKIKDYFEEKKDDIEKVISCDVVNHGNNVRLIAEMKVKRGWCFFSDPEKNYPDLYKEAIRTLKHSCQDLSNCGG